MYIKRGDIVQARYKDLDSNYYFVLDVFENSICIQVFVSMIWEDYRHFEVVTNIFRSEDE